MLSHFYLHSFICVNFFIFKFLDAGATDATDWAIARSLSQLIKAEDAGKLKESQAQVDVQQADENSETNPQMTYSALNQAIEEGDWEAIGAAAALLSSDSYDTDEGSEGSHTSNLSRESELDNLVDSGDWEGVVAAAAKYDAQEASHFGSVSSRGGSSSRASGGGSVGSSGSTNTGPSAFSSSGTVPTTGGTVTSDGNNSRAKKLDEIRAEVAM